MPEAIRSNVDVNDNCFCAGDDSFTPCTSFTFKVPIYMRWRDHNGVGVDIQFVGVYYQCRTCFLDFTSDGWIERDEPNLAARYHLSWSYPRFAKKRPDWLLALTRQLLAGLYPTTRALRRGLRSTILSPSTSRSTSVPRLSWDIRGFGRMMLLNFPLAVSLSSLARIAPLDHSLSIHCYNV